MARSTHQQRAQIGAWRTSVGVKHERFQVSRIHRDRPREGAATPFTSPSSSLLETTETDVMMMAKHGRRVVSREDGKAAGASAHAARVPGSHTPDTRTSFAAVKRTRDADHHGRSRLRATMSSSPDHAHSMSVRRGPASCGRRAHGHGGTTCRRECSRRVFCSRDQIFFLDVLFRVHESKKNTNANEKVGNARARLSSRRASFVEHKMSTEHSDSRRAPCRRRQSAPSTRSAPRRSAATHACPKRLAGPSCGSMAAIPSP